VALESMALSLAKTIVQKAASAWIADRRITEVSKKELGALLTPWFRSTAPEQRILGVAVSDLELFGRYEFRGLDDGEREVALQAVQMAFEREDLTDRALFAVDFDAAKLARRLRAGQPRAKTDAWLSEAGGRFYDAALDRCCELYVRAVQQVPAFVGRASAEMLSRQAETLSRISDVSHQVSDLPGQVVAGFAAWQEAQAAAADLAPQRWASVLPARPTRPVARPDLLAELRRALLAADDRPVLVQGLGGAGKSVLAAEMARVVQDRGDAELAATYPAGVAWVTVGRERSDADIQLDLARAFGEDQPDLDGDWQSGRALLRHLADGQRGVVVLDDVWTQGRYERFRLDAPGVPFLITTRNLTLAGELGGVRVKVGELERDQSRELLASQAGLLPQELPAEAGDLLSLVGNLALGVAMVGAMAGYGGPQAWPNLLRRLRERRLDEIAHKFDENKSTRPC
jgi:NB-ARC domain